MIRFMVVLLALAVAVAGGTWLLHVNGNVAWPSFFTETLILLIFSTALIFGYLYRSDKPDFFVQLYLLSMVVKLVAYGAYMFVVILDDAPGAVANVVFFMATYFIFTVAEIAFLHRKITRR